MKLKDVHLEREKCPREKKEFKVGLKSDGNVTELIDFAPLLQSRGKGLKILMLQSITFKSYKYCIYSSTPAWHIDLWIFVFPIVCLVFMESQIGHK